MSDVSVQALTLLEAVVLLLTNGLGAALAALAWRASVVDVRSAHAWEPATHDGVERTRLRHNRRVVTEDMRHAEARRLQCHGLIALIGIFWLLTPQPANPMVVWWAVAVRVVAICLSILLIEKTCHHLVARWRFNQPWASPSLWRNLWPAVRLAWQDMRALAPSQERNA